MNTELASVKLRLRFVEKYRDPAAFEVLSEGDSQELIRELAPLVRMEEEDEAAKRFDHFMYGLMIASMKGTPGLVHGKRQLCDVAALLETKASISQVKEKLPVIRQIQTDEFLASRDLLLFETIRKELRGLIKFIEDDGSGKNPVVVTKLTDAVVGEREGIPLDSAYNFENYRRKVNRYVEEHKDVLVIYKLQHNIPLTAGDYEELEHILTSELGSREDYQREYGDTPFGLLIRKIAKLDHDAAMQAFSAFINDQSLNQKQIAFVKKVVHHIEQNGYMDDITDLRKPPFDKPISFTKLFDRQKQDQLVEAINSVRDNAVHVVA